MKHSALPDLLAAFRRHRGMAAVLSAVLLGVLLAGPGCTAPSYKMASKKTPPPVLLNLPSTEPPFEFLLHTVIVYRGAGSWKLNAYWDEYVVTVANRGNALITVDEASLKDLRDRDVECGDDPWKLETTSRSLADQGFGLVAGTVVQLGGGIGAISVGAGAGAVIFCSAGGYGALAGGMLVLPAFIGGTIYTNINNHHAVGEEFIRRRLVLPVVLVPGQLVQGSLFFPITPGPRQLILHCHVDQAPRNVVIDLAPLANLHLKSPPVPASPARPRG